MWIIAVGDFFKGMFIPFNPDNISVRHVFIYNPELSVASLIN